MGARTVEDLTALGGRVTRVRVVPVFQGTEGWYMEVRIEVAMPANFTPDFGQPE